MSPYYALALLSLLFLGPGESGALHTDHEKFKLHFSRDRWHIHLFAGEWSKKNSKQFEVKGYGRPVRADYSACFGDQMKSASWYEKSLAECVCFHRRADGTGITRCYKEYVGKMEDSILGGRTNSLTVYPADHIACIETSHSPTFFAAQHFNACETS